MVMPGIGLIKALLVFFDHSLTHLADLTEQLKPDQGENREGFQGEL